MRNSKIESAIYADKPSLMKKKNSENWKITRYSDKEFLSLTRPDEGSLRENRQI